MKKVKAIFTPNTANVTMSDYGQVTILTPKIEKRQIFRVFTKFLPNMKKVKAILPQMQQM